MAMIEATTETFDSLIDAPYAVVDCYGDMCAACVMLEPVYTAAASEMSFIRFGRINISQHFEIAERFGILSMPTLLFFRNGELAVRAEGSMGRDELNQHIAAMLYEQ